jgi:Bacterial regulatory proteins, luxR family
VARLKHSELQSLSKTLLELYSPCLLADLPAHIFTALRQNFSCDSYNYDEFFGQIAVLPARTHVRKYGDVFRQAARASRLAAILARRAWRSRRASVRFPELCLDANVFLKYMDQHPLLQAKIKDGIQCPQKISDYLTLNQWKRTDLWNNYFRVHGFNYQLACLTLNEGPQLGLALNRVKRDFSEEERRIFDLLMPHFFQKFRTSRLFSHLSDAAEAGGQAWLVVDSTGRIPFETGKAVDLLAEYFGHNGSLPTQIRDWLNRRASGLRDSNGLASTLQDFSIRRGTKKLVIRSLSPVESPEQRLFLSESDEELDPGRLLSFGLTKREAEVLLWVSQGKRNSEIGEILGASARTVGKHVEKISSSLASRHELRRPTWL